MDRENLAALSVPLLFAWMPFWISVALWVAPRWLLWLPLAIAVGPMILAVVIPVSRMTYEAEPEGFAGFCVTLAILGIFYGGFGGSLGGIALGVALRAIGWSLDLMFPHR